MRLRTCQSCSRHVLVVETICPFCSQRLPKWIESRPVRIAVGLSRASRLAIVASLTGAASLSACKGEKPSPVMVQPPYGLPPPPIGGASGAVGAPAGGDGGRSVAGSRSAGASGKAHETAGSGAAGGSND
jgi:hypothetical protein